MVRCAAEQLPLLFEHIAKSAALYLPVDHEKGASFQRWTPECVYSKALKTVKSPKEFFFPQTENLMAFQTKGKQITLTDIRSESEDFVIFGVRACDVRSFDVLDRVFLSEPVDSYYASRRAHGILISMACTRPSETCFCSTFGIDPAHPAGDIACWETDTDYYFEAQTERGEALLQTLELAACDSAAVKEQQQLIAARMEQLPLHALTTEGFGGGKTQALFDRPEWNTLSEACLGCGTCTFVCPTCQCYDIKDFSAGDRVVRFRCWDSCMYSDFTKMSAGQPRLTQMERFRQRFMHKLVYYPENNDGLFSCVGCGRCLSSCPISMNIVKVMKTMGGTADE